MVYAKIAYNGKEAYAQIIGNEAKILSGAPHLGTFSCTGETIPLTNVRFLCPVSPSKIVAVGKNYAEHAREMGSEVPTQPILFIKPSTAVIGPNDVICYPPISSRVDYEAELAIVIGKTARNISAADFSDYVAGYTCANDVTARDLQSADGQWTRGKGFDTFAPLGPIVTDEIDPNNTTVEAKLNGKVVQSGSTSDFITDAGHLLAFITQVMTLHPGDVVITGTPAGIGPMQRGDTIEITVGGIGTLTNTLE